MNPNPDVAAAIPAFERAGLMAPERAATALRLSRGELLSVRPELRAALYLGVLLIVAGASVLVSDNYERVGPLAIATAIGLAASGCLFWVFRKAPPFTWQKAPAAGLTLDYVLLLGALLAAADLAFVEANFTALGEKWTWHLFVVSVAFAALALRFDSRTLFSLALSSFAAWRGVAVGLRQAPAWFGEGAAAVRWNALGCGALFLVLAALMRRFDRKRHFEPLTVALAWLLVLGAQASGMIDGPGAGSLWAGALFATGAGLAAYAAWRRRFGLFSLGVFASYAGLSYLVLRPIHEPVLGCGWFFLTATLLIAGLVVAQRRWFRQTLGSTSR